MVAMIRRLRWRAVLWGTGALVLALVGWLGLQQAIGNFHTVIAGELYRSAQPDAAAIRRWHDRYGIRTIINLRGANPGASWYDDEIATAAELGIEHRDFRMSASRHVDGDAAVALLAILRDAPRPILIHCQSGADRTGLASALYVAGIAGLGEERAEGQISLYYGHISLPGTAAWPMDQSWEALEPWLGFTES